MLFGLLLAAAVANWLGRPLRFIAEAAKAVDGGQFRQDIALPTLQAPREVRALLQAVNGVLGTLRHDTGTLERAVSEQNATLHDMNSAVQTLARAMQEPAPPIASVMPGIPVPVADWIDKSWPLRCGDLAGGQARHRWAREILQRAKSSCPNRLPSVATRAEPATVRPCLVSVSSPPKSARILNSSSNAPGSRSASATIPFG
ncbi:MAG: HAMP domain-containing protein [Polyangiaceae bacterium]|nr:HAMP domain-containing protein [Polyangiaceae bacterium]